MQFLLQKSETESQNEVKKQKKGVKKLVKKKKLKKQVSKMCDTTAEMVAKNQQHDISAQSEVKNLTKTKKTSIAKRAANLKKEKRSTLASNITQDLNTIVGDLSQSSYPKPIASSSMASYSKKSDVSHLPQPVTSFFPKTPSTKKCLNVIDEASIHASGKVKQIIQMCEARAKTPSTLIASSKKATCASNVGSESSRVVRNLNLQYGNKTVTKTPGHAVATKHLVQDNPIDKRKERLSARIEAKRQSMIKQATALIKESLDCVDNKVKQEENLEVKHEAIIPGNLILIITTVNLKLTRQLVFKITAS